MARWTDTNRFSWLQMSACVCVCSLASSCAFVDLNAQEKSITNSGDSIRSKLTFIHFDGANSRDTYFTIHKIREAHRMGKGRGIKVGIMDHSFGLSKHKSLYAGGKDFVGNPEALYQVEHHGFWMACVLREIAPECSIYALNTYSPIEAQRVQSMKDAIEWAVANKLEILTYSAAAFSESNRNAIDQAVDYAVRNGIVTTFIHYDNTNNIWPHPMFPLEWGRARMSREPDLNILSYDYNTMFISTYVTAEIEKKKPESGDDIPYFSVSSTSPVVAGFVAVLKSINNSLPPQEYKDILRKTSYRTTFYDLNFRLSFDCKRVADLERAAKHLVENYPVEK